MRLHLSDFLMAVSVLLQSLVDTERRAGCGEQSVCETDIIVITLPRVSRFQTFSYLLDAGTSW